MAVSFTKIYEDFYDENKNLAPQKGLIGSIFSKKTFNVFFMEVIVCDSRGKQLARFDKLTDFNSLQYKSNPILDLEHKEQALTYQPS